MLQATKKRDSSFLFFLHLGTLILIG